jgi:hypothetical protein
MSKKSKKLRVKQRELISIFLARQKGISELAEYFPQVKDIVLLNCPDRKRFATYAQRLVILRRDNYRCRYCGIRLNNKTAVMDHVIPWKYGGPTTVPNLVTCCGDCNKEKLNNFKPPEMSIKVNSVIAAEEDEREILSFLLETT